MTILIMSICFIRFIFLIIVRLFLFFIGFYFIIMDLIYFMEWEIGIVIRVIRNNLIINYLLFLFIIMV